MYVCMPVCICVHVCISVCMLVLCCSRSAIYYIFEQKLDHASKKNYHDRDTCAQGDKAISIIYAIMKLYIAPLKYLYSEAFPTLILLCKK